MENLKKSIVIIGPTASGKTALAIKMYEELGRAHFIVNSDSRQFWSIKELSCSPSVEELKKAPHLLFNCLDNNIKPNLGWWINEIKKIDKKIIVGGNGFYIHSLKNGVPIVKISENTLEKIKNIENKFEYLKMLDPEVKIHKNDQYRVERKLEFLLETGTNFTDYHNKYTEDLEIILINPGIDAIWENIQNRTKNFIDRAIEEINNTKYHENLNSIIGYKEILKFLQGDLSKDILINEINNQTLRYAKHQIKFFKRLKCDIV